MTRAQPQQTEFPGVDVGLVRLTLAGLLETYSERVARAESGGERDSLFREYAIRCKREVAGLQGREWEDARVELNAILASVGATP